jgi:ketosteroid isomerase-like protein
VREERRLPALALCLALGAFSIANNAPAQTPEAAKERAVPDGVTRFFRDYFTAVEAGDPDGILALVDSDFVIKWPIGHPISDRGKLRAALAKLQENVRQTVEWEIAEARIEGEWAWARVNETATHVPKDGSNPRILEGSHLAILRKVGGRWLLHRDYGSLNQMPEALR